MTSNMDGGDGARKDLAYSLYVNPNGNDMVDAIPNITLRDISTGKIEEAIRGLNPVGLWRIFKTGYGIMCSFEVENDALALLNTPLADTLGGPVQVARFSKSFRHKQTLIIRDVPWAIPAQEIKVALEQIGMLPHAVSRVRQNIRVDLSDPIHCEMLLRDGLNFYGATRFIVVPERWKNTTTRNDFLQDSILQCYRCQGFWHIAANCQHMPRCVRCGDNHSVEECPRPRHSPICCHCAGPHHAAYRQCPVRLQLINSAPPPPPPPPAHMGFCLTRKVSSTTQTAIAPQLMAPSLLSMHPS